MRTMTLVRGMVVFGGMLASTIGCTGSDGAEAPGLACGASTHEENGVCIENEAGTGGSGGTQEEGGTGGTAGAGGSGGTGGTGGSSGSGGSAGSGPVDPTGDCPKGLEGPTLIEVSTPGGQRYCIDATEVTWAQYKQFKLAKGNDTSGQPSACAWNDTYENWDPDHNCNAGPADGPAYCTDWCDAFAYCAWAGKHLCGKIGGGTLAFADGSDAESAEWYNACSNGGKTAYPYGDAYDETACACEQNPTLAGQDFPMDVGSLPECSGVEQPFASVYDLSGNVGEWIDACEGTSCQIRGGGWAVPNGVQQPACADPKADYRQINDGSIGFRCCAAVEQ